MIFERFVGVLGAAAARARTLNTKQGFRVEDVSMFALRPFFARGRTTPNTK